MKTQKVVLVLAIVIVTGLLGSCEQNDIAENDSLYEVHSVDKRDVERPGDQGGS